MKITKDELLKEIKTGEALFSLEKLAADMGLGFNKYQGNICVEGGADIIIEGEELTTTFYNITVNADGTILMLQNNIFGNAPYEPFCFDVDTSDEHIEETETEIDSKITTVRIELGIDIDKADKVSMRYDGRIFSLSDYIKEAITIEYDTSLFKTGDIVKITTKMHNRRSLTEIELIDTVGMIEYFNERTISYQTLDIESGALKHYKFHTIDFILNNISEFSIEKVNIQ